MDSGFDELSPDLEGVGEAGAGGGEIEAPCAFRPNFFLDEAGRGGEEHVRRDGGDNDDLDLGGCDPAFGEAGACGFRGEVAGGYAGFDDVTLANAGALHDPLVVGGNHLSRSALVRSFGGT